MGQPNRSFFKKTHLLKKIFSKPRTKGNPTSNSKIDKKGIEFLGTISFEFKVKISIKVHISLSVDVAV